jgi:uncharacterized membrane protein YfcA
MWILSSIVGFLSGGIGAMGLGGGAVLLIYLTVFDKTPQFKAQGMNLIFFIPIALLAVIIYAFKREIKWKKILPLIFGGFLGSGIGLVVSNAFGQGFVAKIFAVLLIALGVKELFAKDPLKKGKESGILKKE